MTENIQRVQKNNGLKISTKDEIINNGWNFSIEMETGTGKTYVYLRTIYELNKLYGFKKFVIVVPSVAIREGVMKNLEITEEHFQNLYDKVPITSNVYDSRKVSNLRGFASANTIQVLVINIDSFAKDENIINKPNDKLTGKKPIEFIQSCKPFVIVDEPQNMETEIRKRAIENLSPLCTLRYSATHTNLYNLLYSLNPVKAYDLGLVKQIEVDSVMSENDFNDCFIQLESVNRTGNNITAKIKIDVTTTSGIKRKSVTTNKNKLDLFELSGRNEKYDGVKIYEIDFGSEQIELSNGIVLKKGETQGGMNDEVMRFMISKTVEEHLKKEKNYKDKGIKVLSLFFIDKVKNYREYDSNGNPLKGKFAKWFEEIYQKEISKPVYKGLNSYSVGDLHNGYFSQDNKGRVKDTGGETQLDDDTYKLIMQEKEKLLDVNVPLRFIFSHSALREGWDNPNVFQICKLRSSGSEISKLQEVGRGLRLPVNEYGNRVKDEQFYLNYFVDFTESDFVDKLVNEINQKSGAISIEVVPDKLSDIMIKKICELYETTEDELLEVLDSNNVVTRTNSFKTGGFDFIKQNYPKIFEGVNSNKVRKATDPKKKVVVRTEKYQELKDLWEKLNEKVILEYKFDNEASFKTLFTEFLKSQKDNFTSDGINEIISKIEIKDNKAVANEPESVYNRKTATISIMKYSDFLKELSKILNINIKTLHQSIIDAGTDINKFLNETTLRVIKQNFDHYLMANAIDKFSIEYKKVSNNIHPTKLTDEKGNVLNEISASDVGVLFSDEDVAKSYFFDELYYDSDLEKTNIKSEIKEVIVFTKIPKNSIKIPVAGGKSYSPDFAYVLKFKDGEQKLNFIVETKDVNSKDGLRDEEKFKIKHAEKFFDGKVKIEFRTQFSNNKIVDLIKNISVNE